MMKKTLLHPKLRSQGEIDLKIVEAFFRHLDLTQDGFLSVDNCKIKLGEKLDSFPRLEEMFTDVRCSGKVPEGSVDLRSLYTYLTERKSSVLAVDIDLKKKDSALTIPRESVDAFMSAAKSNGWLPSKKQTVEELCNEVNKVLSAASVAEDIQRLFVDTVLFNQTAVCPKSITLTNMRQVTQFKRSKFWREWVGLVRVLESDPIKTGSPLLSSVAPPVGFGKFAKIQRAVFVPANSEKFRVPKKTESTSQFINAGTINEKEVGKVIQVVRKQQAQAKEPKPRISPAMSKVRDFPCLDAEPYSDGAMVDSSKSPHATFIGKPFVNRVGKIKDKLELLEEAAKNSLRSTQKFEPLEQEALIGRSSQTSSPKAFSTFIKPVGVERIPSGLPWHSAEEREKEIEIEKGQQFRESKFKTLPVGKIAKVEPSPVSLLWSGPSIGNPLLMDRDSKGLCLNYRPITAAQIDKCYSMSSI